MNSTGQATRNPHRTLLPLIYSLLLAVFFSLSLAQLTSTSPTFDEGFTFLRGYAAWRTGYLIPIGHPPLAHWFSALGVSLEPNLPDPRDLEGWYGDKYDDSSRDLLWQRGLNTDRIVFLGRIPILFLGLILGSVTARWAKDLFGWGTGAAALALHAFSPNLLAHSALATTDLPVAAFYVFTLYRWHHFTRHPTILNAVFTGLMLGCALASKFNSLLLLPTLALLALIYLIRNIGTHPDRSKWAQHTLRFTLLSFTCLAPSALLTLWANYGFALSPYPLSQYVRELADLQSLASEGHAAYLLGQLSLTGWWYYHPLVFLFKTPLPLIILIAAGLWHILSHRALRWEFATWVLGVSSAIYLTTTTLSSLNVGYRYLLPALPLLHLFAASLTQRMLRATHRGLRIAFGALFFWYFASMLLISPHFLAYFNELTGPAGGYKVLSDSNLDWGQDLPALAQYLQGRRVYLSYFGQADPAHYGIRYESLPAWPPHPSETPFAPADPAPGLYAISASNLVGVQLEDPNTFAYFRNLEPLAMINYSIFVYEVPEHDPITTLAQCNPPILNQNAVAELLDNRAMRQITFDCGNSIVVPALPSLILYPEDQSPIFNLPSLIFNWDRADGTTYYRLYRVSPGSPSTPLFPARYLSLLDFAVTQEALTLTWRVDEPAPPPVSIFVHFNWPDGALAEAYDALGFPAEQWQIGDVIIQHHPISPDLPPGEYSIVVGLYSLADGTRYSEIPLAKYIK